VSVLPATGKVEIVIDLQGAAEIHDFTLDSPARLVIDLIGTRLTAPAALYDGLNRGGVKNIRYAQFKPDVVRVVIDLDALKDYQVDRSGGQVHIRIGSERTGFVAWSSATVTTASVPPRRVAERGSGGEAAPPVTGGPEQAAHVTTPTTGRSLSIDEYLAVHRDEATQSQAPRITVQWDNASIEDVIAGFAAFSGRTIILGRDIKGNVTAEIKNQPWDLALNAVLESQGLAVQTLPGGILSLAEVADPMPVEHFLSQREPVRLLVFCDEAAEVSDPLQALREATRAADGIDVLIGPEGGFAEEERAPLLRQPHIVRLSLGPRILRADTAGVAALALVQAVLGDWRWTG
jgi:hypothetical protein